MPRTDNHSNRSGGSTRSNNSSNHPKHVHVPATATVLQNKSSIIGDADSTVLEV